MDAAQSRYGDRITRRVLVGRDSGCADLDLLNLSVDGHGRQRAAVSADEGPTGQGVVDDLGEVGS